MCKLEDYDRLHLCYIHRANVQQELRMWHEKYLPIKPNHLDGGAGCGETVQFYLSHGAEHVLAIECDPACIDNLNYNFGKDQRVTIVPFKIGSMKFDVEGAEKNMVFEAHFPFRVRRLYGFPAAVTTLNRVEEDWGSLLTKARRRVGMWLIH